MMKSINPRDLMERSRDKTKVSPLIEISKRFDQVYIFTIFIIILIYLFYFFVIVYSYSIIIVYSFKKVSAWVTSEVVSTAHHKQRVLVITNFVHVIEVIKLSFNHFFGW